MSGIVKLNFKCFFVWILLINGCNGDKGNEMTIVEEIQQAQIPGQYVRRNFDTEERLVLNENGSYEWEQRVLQEEALYGYSHSGKWAIEQNEIVLTPGKTIPDVHMTGLRYKALSKDGFIVLIQSKSSKQAELPQADRFIYYRKEPKLDTP